MTYGTAPAGAISEIAVKFILEVDSVALTAFEKITISDSEWGVVPNRTGNDGLNMQEDSGLKKVQTIEFTKHHRAGGTADIKQLLTWHNAGAKDKRSGAVVYFDRDDTELMRLNFKDGWVMKVKPPESDAETEDAKMTWVFTLSIAAGLEVA